MRFDPEIDVLGLIENLINPNSNSNSVSRVGSLGDLVFEVSTNKVLTFTDATKSVSARHQKHDIHLNSPILEFIGEDLTEFKINVSFDKKFGINPQSQVEQLEKYVKEGSILNLMIGNVYMGKFAITRVNQSIPLISGKGEILKIAVEINLTESKYYAS